MQSLAKTGLLLTVLMAVFALHLGDARALTQDQRTGPFKVKTNSPYRFGFKPQPKILPGTKPKRECVAHGQARCIKRPRPASPFAAQGRQQMDSTHPLIKRNQPIRPEPSY